MPGTAHPVFALPEWLPHLGGLATFYLHLARCRSELGLPTTILTTQKEAVDPGWPHVTVVKLADQRYEHFVRYGQWLPDGWEVAAMSLAAGTAMRDWLREHAPANSVTFAAEFLGYASILCGPELPPLVVTAHGSMGQIAARSQGGMQSPDAGFVRMIESDALLRADLTTAYSPTNAAEWSATLQRNIPCIDPPFFPYQDLDTKENTARPSAPLRCIVVGRLQDWKGALTLADALELLTPDERTKLRIDWYGGDTSTAPGGASLAQWLEQHHPDVFGKCLRWHGPIPREQVLSRQAEADLCLVPSMWDTLNFTALEAMAAGTPVAISTGAGAAYLVDDDTGFTFPANNPQALADTLRHLLTQAEQLPAMGQRCKQQLAERFAPAACVHRYNEAAQQAINARQSPYAHLRLDGTGNSLLPLIETIMQADKLPRRSSRELISALTQKFSQRLGLDG